MGIFSPKKQMFPGIPPMGPYNTPGFGDGMIERQMDMQELPQSPMMAGPRFGGGANPDGTLSLGGFNQGAAMQGQSGFEGQQPAAKKPGPNWAGIAADFLAGMAGQPGQFAAQQQHERAMQQRTQQAEQERTTRREDMQWEWQNKPQQERAPYRWESNDGSLMEIGPDGEPVQKFKDPTPKITMQRVDNQDGTFQIIPFGPDGRPVSAQPAPMQAPPKPIGRLRPLGGQPGGSSPFVR